MELKYD
jgi:hypothetical protein